MTADSPQTFGEPPQSAGAPPGEPTPRPPASTPPPPAGDWITRLIQPVQESRSWLRFMGFVSIAIGGLSALTIVGLIVAWLYIWIGILLWQAGDRAGWAYAQKSAFMLEQYLGKLRSVIVILGVVTAIHVVMTVLAIGFFFTFGGLAAVINAMD